MSNLIQRLAQQTRHTFLPLARGAEPHQLEQLIRLAGTVSAKDLDFDPEWVSNTEKYRPSVGNAPVTYVHIDENEYFSMGIFILRNGYALPLHDHPAMYGICKVIHGKVGITSYSLANDRPVPPSLLKEVSPLRPTLAEKTVELDQSSCCCLSPTRMNIHRIQAVDGPAAFLDILAPPYDHSSRNCSYYEEVLEEEDGTSWLAVVPPPKEYWCHQERYTGPSVDPQ